ncbi:MAG TPA: hypothetical protein VF682_19220 [Pseudomonas sp.]|jgi:hypothetical protein
MDIEHGLRLLLPQIQALLGNNTLSYQYHGQDRSASFTLRHPEGGLLIIHEPRPDIIALNGPEKPAQFFIDQMVHKRWPI